MTNATTTTTVAHVLQSVLDEFMESQGLPKIDCFHMLYYFRKCQRTKQAEWLSRYVEIFWAADEADILEIPIDAKDESERTLKHLARFRERIDALSSNTFF